MVHEHTVYRLKSGSWSSSSKVGRPPNLAGQHPSIEIGQQQPSPFLILRHFFSLSNVTQFLKGPLKMRYNCSDLVLRCLEYQFPLAFILVDAINTIEQKLRAMIEPFWLKTTAQLARVGSSSQLDCIFFRNSFRTVVVQKVCATPRVSEHSFTLRGLQEQVLL